MTVSNGQLANQNTFNTSYLSREIDTDTVGKVDLKNVDVASGANVLSIQRFINSVASALGMTTAEVYNFLFTYSSDVVGASNNTVLARLNAITEKFRGGVGLAHAHTGADGQGEKVSATNLENINQLFAEWQAFVAIAATGGSTVVSTQMIGKTPNGSSVLAGVITSAPNNKIALYDNVTLQQFEDAGGQKIYGRLTESGGVWTLTYYTNEAGVETAYSFGSAVDIQAFYLEVFTLATRPTIPSAPEFGSLDVTGDVVDATATQRGVVTTLAQSFGGLKSFNNGIVVDDQLVLAQTNNSSSTGANQTITLSGPNIALTNAGLTSVAGLLANVNTRFAVVTNKTGAAIVLVHESGAATAADRIVTPTAGDMNWSDDQGLSFIYNTTDQRWNLVGGAAGADDAVPVKTVATTDTALTGLYAIDSYTLLANDRVMVTGQNVPADNGIYVAAAGAWSRAADMNATNEVILGKMYLATSGSLYQETAWAVTVVPAVLGVNPLLFAIVGVSRDLSNLRTTNINMPDLIFANNAAPVRTVKSADVTTTGGSKQIRFKSGDVTTPATGNSGAVSLISGDSATAAGNSGTVNVKSGAAAGSTGSIIVSTGASTGSGNSGGIQLSTANAPGAGQGHAGGILIAAGDVVATDASPWDAGVIEIYGGDNANASGGVPGYVDIKAGDGTGTSDVGGPVYIASGSAAGASGIGGNIQLQTGTGATNRGDFQLTARFCDLLAQTPLKFWDSSNTNSVGFKTVASLAGSVMWELPQVDGTSGQVLKTNGAAVLSWVNQSGGTTKVFSTKTANYTILSTDQVIIGDTTSNDITLTMPSAASVSGQTFTVKRKSAGAFFLKVTSSSGTIDGAADYFVDNQWESVDLFSDGVNYYITSKVV